MKPQKIENILQLVDFINEYYNTEHKEVMFNVVSQFLNTCIVRFGDAETKESFIDKVWGFYEYCLTSKGHIPPFLIKDPTDEFQIIQLLEAYY